MLYNGDGLNLFNDFADFIISNTTNEIEVSSNIVR